MSEVSTDRRAVDRGTPDRRSHPRDVFVEFREVSKAYGAKKVLRGASLEVYRGEVLVILGGSGTGKSVTLRHMLGLEAPDEGRVIVDGEDITDFPEEELYRVRRKFGMLFQSGALFDSMTVFENVAFPLREHTDLGEEEIAQAVQQRLELVHLPAAAQLMPVDLSGGMRKRVGLARSIVLDPQVILYDEPTTGLDPITSQKINELIVDLQSKLNVTSIVVTHDIQSAFSVGDRIAFLNDGVFEWVGTMDDARDADHPKLRDFLKASSVVAAQATRTGPGQTRLRHSGGETSGRRALASDMATTTKQKSARVGLLVTISLVILMVFVFFIGSEQKIFARKNEYTVRLESASGLAEGNPVRMSGVTIGVVRDIRLPRDPKERQVEITLMVDRKYAERIRGDSRVRLKKLGLLTGDAYIDITPGTPRFAVLESGSVIPAQRQTDVESLISSGEDLVDNFVQISYSLKNILQRIDRGEGLLGELTTAPETRQRITDTFLTTLNKTNAVLKHVESGRGVLGKLIYDDTYAETLTASVGGAARSMQEITLRLQTSIEKGEGAIPALLTDPEGKRRVYEIVENLRATSGNLSAFTTTMQSGEGIVPRLLGDKEYADEALGEFTTLVRQLNEIVAKVNRGDGTAGRLISDPAIYESVNDILIGINESKLLRWIIRNRQQSGINRRATELQKSGTAQQPAPAPEPVDDVVPVVIVPTTTGPVTIVPATVPPTDTQPPAETQPSPATTTQPPVETQPPPTTTAPPPADTQPPPTSTQPE